LGTGCAWQERKQPLEDLEERKQLLELTYRFMKGSGR
jgi:hypothetical protein